MAKGTRLRPVRRALPASQTSGMSIQPSGIHFRSPSSAGIPLAAMSASASANAAKNMAISTRRNTGMPPWRCAVVILSGSPENTASRRSSSSRSCATNRSDSSPCTISMTVRLWLSVQCTESICERTSRTLPMIGANSAGSSITRERFFRLSRPNRTRYRYRSSEII